MQCHVLFVDDKATRMLSCSCLTSWKAVKTCEQLGTLHLRELLTITLSRPTKVISYLVVSIAILHWATWYHLRHQHKRVSMLAQTIWANQITILRMMSSVVLRMWNHFIPYTHTQTRAIHYMCIACGKRNVLFIRPFGASKTNNQHKETRSAMNWFCILVAPDFPFKPSAHLKQSPTHNRQRLHVES